MYSTINIFRTIRTPIFTESYFSSLFVSYVRTVHSTVDSLQDIHHQGNFCSTQTLFEYHLVAVVVYIVILILGLVEFLLYIHM